MEERPGPDGAAGPEAAAGGLLPQLRLDDLLGELQSRLAAIIATRDRMHGLLEAVIAIGSGLDLEATLRRIVQAAADLAEGGGTELEWQVPVPPLADPPGDDARPAVQGRYPL